MMNHDCVTSETLIGPKLFDIPSICSCSSHDILNYFMAYRVYLSDYLPLDIGTTAAYLSTGANQFALKILTCLFNQ